jgi:hypothetical protein
MQFNRLKRREFIAVLIGAAAWPLAAHPQQRDRVKRLGVLWGLAENDSVYEPHLSAFKQRLQDLGWIEYRFTGGVTERIRIAAQELAALAPDVIFATTNPAARLYCTRRRPFRLSLRSSPIQLEAVSFQAWRIRAEILLASTISNRS